MKFALGKKLNMTQVFDMEGFVFPVTLVSLEKMKVTLKREKDKDGYESLGVSYGEKKDRKTKKIKHSGTREFKVSTEGHNVNDEINPNEIFEKGDVVRIISVSKGKGFQGVVKKYGFAGAPRTHGQKDTERRPGSIGLSRYAKVVKGKKMPGRMGGKQVTVKGAEIIDLDKEKGILFIKGSIPGRKGTLVKIQCI